MCASVITEKLHIEVKQDFKKERKRMKKKLIDLILTCLEGGHSQLIEKLYTLVEWPLFRGLFFW